MMPDPENELLDLIEKSFEGQLTDQETARLVALCNDSPRALQTYVDFCALHAELQLSGGQAHVIRPLPIRENDFADGPPHGRSKWALSDPVSPSRAVPTFVTTLPAPSILVKAAIATVAAALFCTGGYWFSALSDQQTYIAQLIEAKECRWKAGTLPTELNAKLTPGRLRLSDGLAAILFTSGVQLRLEGPADIEVISPMKCIVHSGRVLAKVPPSGKGFVMVTPSSVLTDYGTEFGVNVGEGNDAAMVTVFKGRVDAFHPRLKRTEKMESGASFRFTQSSMAPINSPAEALSAAAESNSSNPNTTEHNARTPQQVQITTAQGRGRDAFIQPMEIPDDRTSETLLLVKRPFPSMEQWERRAYLGFDLSDLEGKQIDAAELSLTFASTGYGFAYLVPDTRFNIYGLTNSGLTSHGPAEDYTWDEQTISWDNAPGLWDINQSPPLNVKPLGTFEIKQGVQSGNFKIATNELRDFLNDNPSKLATLIVVRETVGFGTSDLVHGIASRRHPTLSPPTLRLSLQ